MSALVDFYRGETRDSEGRLLHEIWAWNDNRLEDVHNFIQWLFPLPEPSRFNSNAPLLTEDDIATFRSDQEIQANLRKSFERFLTFLGLASSADGTVIEGPNLLSRSPDVWSVPNHNWLRITRILRSLKILGLEREAQALYARLESFYSQRRFPITADTFRFWTDATK